MPLSAARHRRPRTRGLVAFALAACLASALIIAGGGETAAGQADKRPNIVVVMTDDQDYRSLRVMPQVRSLLGRHGVKFTRSYATFPLCCPSRVTYLTGQYSHNHGVRNNKLPDGGFPVYNEAPAASANAAVALQANGYKTAWIGKFLNGYPNYGRQFPKDIPDGFDHWMAGLGLRMFDWALNANGRIIRFGRKDSDYNTDVYARKGKQFIERSAPKERPFFLTLGPGAPHGEPSRDKQPNPRPAPRHKGTFKREPLPKPPSFNERDVDNKPEFVRRADRLDADDRVRIRDRYRARLESLLAVDDMVGKVVRTLREAGELRNTYIIFTSDNGYLQGEHRLTGKTVLYRESAQVPLIIRGPGIPRREKHEGLTANVDLAPTIYDISGTSPLLPPDGTSLLPLAENPDGGPARTVLLENRRSNAVITSRYSYAEHELEDGGGVEEFELYDLNRDPYQLENWHVLDAPQVRPDAPGGLGEVRDDLADRLDDLRGCAGAGCF